MDSSTDSVGLTRVLRATGLLGLSSVASVAVGVAAAKVYAVTLGPSGVGYMTLLQSVLGLATMVAGLGVAPALVRSLSQAIERHDVDRYASFASAAWLLTWFSGLAGSFILLAGANVIDGLFLRSRVGTIAFLFLAPALLLGLLSQVQLAIVNAHRRIADLSLAAVASSVLGAIVTVALVIWRGRTGVAPSLALSALLALIVAVVIARRRPMEPSGRPALAAIRRDSAELVRFGGPVLASLLVGTGVEIALPVLVLHLQGTAAVGFYRTAALVSMTYPAFLLTALSKDYFPRISAVADKAQELARRVNQQYHLTLLLGTPLVLAAMALAPFLIPVIYSDHFRPATRILEYQLYGDIFKFASWTWALSILARGASRTFFLTESIGGAAVLGCSLLGMLWWGLAGLGAAYLASYVIYYLVVWAAVRRHTGFALSPGSRALTAFAILTTGFIEVLTQMGLQLVSTPVALLCALACGGYAAYFIRTRAALEHVHEVPQPQ